MVQQENPYESPRAVEIATPPAAGAKRQRSRFWIVSTHVITTGFAMPFLASLAAVGVPSVLPGESAIPFLLAFQAVGYIGGTYYSLSYLRKQTTIADPKGCTKASVITFVVLALLGLALNIAVARPVSLFQIVYLTAFYVLVSIGFARITKKGFAEMASSPTFTA